MIRQSLLDIALAKYQLREEPHGRPHWARVHMTSMRLARGIDGLEMCSGEMFYYFAVFHDCCRIDDNKDPHHGARAAAYLSRLFESADYPAVTLSTPCQDAILKAIAQHTAVRYTPDPFVGICWDSDRLDLPRVGIEVDPKFLSTRPARAYLKERTRDLQTHPETPDGVR